MQKPATEIEALKAEIDGIKARNRRVEADKAWELSKTRSSFIAASTYLLILIFMLLIKDDHAFLNAFIASVGYLISTATYGILKKWWLKRRSQTV
ncbi:MAG: hypothetical protein Q8Q49_05330 [bacterium]|nr:hypothetical protein [bacterium]